MALTAATYYFSQQTGLTLTTAHRMFLSFAAGTANFTTASISGHPTGFSELYAAGTSNAWQQRSSPGPASGNGFTYDGLQSLTGQQFPAGIWSGQFVISTGGTGSYTFVPYMRVFIYNSITSLFRAVGVLSGNSVSYTCGSGNMSIPLNAATLPTVSLYQNDYLYQDIWVNITANTATGSLSLVEGTTAGHGTANAFIVTPGYQPTPVLAGAIVRREQRHSRTRISA